jgi:hypothetical protein
VRLAAAGQHAILATLQQQQQQQPASQITHPDIILLQHIICPGFHPAQLVYLTLEYICVLGLGQDRLTSDLAGLSLLSLVLLFTKGQVNAKVPAAEASVQKQYAEGCVEYIWSGLGRAEVCVLGLGWLRQSLRATAHRRQMQQTLGAAAARLGTMPHSGGRVWMWSCLQMQQQGCV